MGERGGRLMDGLVLAARKTGGLGENFHERREEKSDKEEGGGENRKETCMRENRRQPSSGDLLSGSEGK